MRNFAVCNLLQLLIVCIWLVSLFVNYNHIFLCSCHYTVVFALSVLNIIRVLDLELVYLILNIYTIIILHNVLLLTCSISFLFFFIVDLWNANKILISTARVYEYISTKLKVNMTFMVYLIFLFPFLFLLHMSLYFYFPHHSCYSAIMKYMLAIQLFRICMQA